MMVTVAGKLCKETSEKACEEAQDGNEAMALIRIDIVNK